MRAALILYLLEERQEAARQYGLFRREHVEVSAAVADACLAPTDQRWTWILRQDNYLDRQIERKIRLLDMLQERRRKRQAAAQAPEPPPPPYMEMQIRSHQVDENTMAASSSLARGKPRARARGRHAGLTTRRFAPSG